jgi:putative transposase
MGANMNQCLKAFIEAFNARFRAQCLNASCFLSLAEACNCIEEWRCHYNEDRPHTARGNLTSNQFVIHANQAKKLPSLWTRVGAGPQQAPCQQSKDSPS